MSELHQAVQAEIAVHTPAVPPSFDVLKARKRAQDRRRLAASGAALSAVAVAGAVLVLPALTGGEDRAVPAVGSADNAQRAEFEVSYTAGPEAHGPEDEEALRSCTAYPGGSRDLQKQSDPPVDVVSVIGRPAAVSAFRQCLDGLPDARVTASGITPLDRLVTITLDYRTPVDRPQDDTALLACLDGPVATAPQFRFRQPPLGVLLAGGTAGEIAEVERCLTGLPNVDVTVQEASSDPEPAADRNRTFYVSIDGPADAAAYTTGVEGCLELDGVTGNSVQESYPATYQMTARGPAAEILAACLAGVPGAQVQATDGTPAEGVELDAFVNRCVGAENPALTPAFLGLPEEEATRAESQVLAADVRTIRIIGRDGVCLGRTRDVRSDRVNLIIADGKVVWAGRF